MHQALRPKTAFLTGCLIAAACVSFTSGASADEGMWLFNRPPTKKVQEKYGFELTPPWLEHVQKSCVRISSGGSGSLVSSRGLVMTNHHVGRDIIQKLSTAERNFMSDGFYAKTVADEIKCPDLEMDILWTIDDVTDQVKAVEREGQTGAQMGDARRKRISEIQDGAKAQNPGMKCEVVTLYQGGLYHLYKYKTYTDIRLVMAPEHDIASFGGDPDNFEFPRYCLDMSFFRIFENDKPLAAEHFLKWSRNGVSDGDLVFVAGHPGRTERLFTVDHLKFLRDVSYPILMRNLWRREVQLNSFAGRSEENRRICESDLLSVENSRKARTGIFAGLIDPALMKAKRDAEALLRAKVEANPEWKAKWGDAWDQIARAEKAYAVFYPRLLALGSTRMALGGKLFEIARDLYRASVEKQKPSAERLREYSDAEQKSLAVRVFSPAPIHPALEIEKLTASLQLMCELLGTEDPLVQAALQGKSPTALAQECVIGTSLGDVAERKRMNTAGETAFLDSKDPLILLVRRLDDESRLLRKRYEDEVESQERLAYAKISAALFAAYGADQYPDATFSLRLTYGAIKGYSEAGKDIAPFTQLAGLFKRSDEHRGAPPFSLPKKWLDARTSVNPNTPYNFVSTCDIIGGNSGSPSIDKNGEVVGLIFDGNIQSLVLNNAYEETQARAVSVDSRAILEALRKVYPCQALADELTGPTGP